MHRPTGEASADREADTGGRVPQPDVPVGPRQALADHTTALFLRAREAGPEERQRILDEIVTSHLWLAETLSRRFWHRGEDPDDLLQVACAGLVEATRRFDVDQGAFLSYAVPTILGVLKRHFRDHGWLVRPPRRTQELVAGMRRQWPELVQALGELPKERDLASRLGESMDAIHQARHASQSYSPWSIDAAVARGVSFPSDESVAEMDRAETRLILREAMEQLTHEEQQLLWLRFFEQRSQSDIAAAIGTSQMQVSRLLARLLNRLRTTIGSLDSLPAAS